MTKGQEIFLVRTLFSGIQRKQHPKLFCSSIRPVDVNRKRNKLCLQKTMHFSLEAITETFSLYPSM
jgi:hypothetical protein